MCRPSKSPESSTTTERNGPRVLLSLASYDAYDGTPPMSSLAVTCMFFVAMLTVSELVSRRALESIEHWHPLLEIEVNRQILARHIGIDSLCCFTVTILGWQCRELLSDIYNGVFGPKGYKTSLAYEPRLFTYHPAAARITLFFFSYQIKNTYDTIVWHDGIEFLMHHILCMGTAWGALIPGSAHGYVPFYFGISEASTAVLTLLANFDDVHGVPGLADAFPMVKMALGGTFAFLFLICRVFMWSTVSFYYCRDAYNAVTGTDPRVKGRKLWLQFTFVSLGLLSLLQIVWLGQIVIVGMQEMEKMGMI